MQAQKRAILQRISIHAPARGATRSLFRIAKAGSYFNPRSREGSDVNPLPRRGASIRFQSTLPRGERQVDLNFFHAICAFQSTLPRGERHAANNIIKSKKRFQSTLPRGERRFAVWFVFDLAKISIHAPARGATKILPVDIAILAFQSTLPRGERRCNRWRIFRLSHHFNPRSREGSDPDGKPDRKFLYDFNPRSREGSD